MCDLLQREASKIAEKEGFCDYKIETKNGSNEVIANIFWCCNNN